MEYYITSPMLFAAACLTYIVTGVICGFVRWSHMCRPYDENGDYYYPARKQVSFFFTAVVLQFPYLLNPISTDAQLYARIFGILFYPLCFSSMFRSYFRKENFLYSKLSVFGYFLVFSTLSVFVLVCLIGDGNVFAGYAKPILWVVAAISVVITIKFTLVCKWLKKRIDAFNRDNYSDEKDFPYSFAKSVLPLPFIVIVLMAVLFITGNPWIKFAIDLIIAVWMVIFLTRILHPNFKPAAEEKAKEILAADTDNSDTISEANDSEARQMVLDILTHKFKNPHLQKSELLEAVPKGMKGAANRFVLEIGYYNLVNMFRLRYANLYLEAHPAATQDEIASVAGFSTRYALYRARKNVESIDMEIVQNVSI